MNTRPSCYEIPSHALALAWRRVADKKKAAAATTPTTHVQEPSRSALRIAGQKGHGNE